MRTVSQTHRLTHTQTHASEVNKYLPFQHKIYLDIADHDGNEGTKEDLTVEDGVIEVSTLDGSETKQEQLDMVANLHRAAEVLEEVE